jgi:hypothetical protein
VSSQAARRAVLDSVLAGDRARRQARAWVIVARILPWTAAAAGAISLAALPFGRVRLLGAIVLAAGVLAAAAILAATRLRRRAPSDRVVAGIDAAAGFGGALRSAHWFAADRREHTRPLHDPNWVAHHIETTAARATAVAWRVVYARRSAARAWLVTAAFGTAALILAGVDPPRRPSPAQAALEDSADTLIVIPPHVSGDVVKGMNALKAGRQPSKEALVAVGQAIEIAKKDPRARRALDELFALGSADDAALFDDGWLGDHDWDVNEMPWDDATPGVEWAYEAAASRAALEDTPARPDPARRSGRESGGRMGTLDRGRRPAQPPDGAPLRADTRGQPGSFASLLFGRQQATDDAAGAPPPNAGAAWPALVAALRREVVHAQRDASDATRPAAARGPRSAGEPPGDPRAIAPTGLRYDASAAAHPPAVPEARQALLHDVFVRPPLEDPAVAGPR